MRNQIKTVVLKFEVNRPAAVAELIEHQEEIDGLNLIAAQHKEKKREKMKKLTHNCNAFDRALNC
jgi:hypothetical protein